MALTPPAPSAPAPPPHVPWWAAGWRLLLPALAMLVLLAALLGTMAAGAAWLLRSEDGTAWLLARLPGVHARGVHGALLSERFGVDHLELRWNRGDAVIIEGLQGDGMAWTWRPAGGGWFALDAAALHARRVVVALDGPVSPRPLALPRTLDLGARVTARTASVDVLQWGDYTPLQRLVARGVVVGKEHRVEALDFDVDRAHGTASGRIAATAPFTIDAKAVLAAPASPDAVAWSADVRAAGPLARIELQATLRGKPRPGTEAPALDAAATVVPLEAWPLAKLALRTRALDLAALHGAAPRTKLAGSVEITSRAYDVPVRAEVHLENTLPGRWDEQRLPLARLEAAVRGRIDRRDAADFERIDVQFASGAENAGRARGSGQWRDGALHLKLAIDALRPQLVDSRAAAMTLAGPLELRWRSATAAPPPRPGAAAAPTPGAGPGAAPAKAAKAAEAWALDVKGVLDGRLDAAPRDVQLTFDATASPRVLDVKQLRALAGPALATLNARAERTGGGDWQLRSAGTLTDFDPVAWWPGSEGSAWRQGPHRLSGTWTVDVRLPAKLPRTDALAFAQAAVGSGTLRIADSTLAGVPLAARFDLAHRAAAGAAPSRVQGEVALGSNRLVVDGQGDPAGDGRHDRMRIDVQADQVAALAPLARLVPDLADWMPRGGQAGASVTLQGRWPEVLTEGRLQATALQLGHLAIGSAKAEWRLDSTAGDEPLLLQLEGQRLEFERQRLQTLTANLRGTLRQHRLDLAAALPLQPPRALEVLFGLRTRAGTLVQMQAEGQWQRERGGGRWNGRVAQLLLGAWDGTSATPVGGGGWVEARDLRADATFDAQSGFTLVHAAAGQLRVADSVTLRWDDVRVDLRGSAPAIELRAQIEPFALAPLLARSQPGFGWGGDLTLAARLELRAAEKLDAEVHFERRSGDLRIVDDNGVQSTFGLSEVRASLSAHDGRWLARAAFAGRTIGEASATLHLRPRPDQRWPSGDTPIDGAVEAQVASIGIWNAWVPPGWRLAGSVRTSARVTGRIADPDYTGEVRADDIAVRNLLQGVDLRGGMARIKLAGAAAQLEEFTLHAGDGKLTARGSAELGLAPTARIRLDAEHFRLLGRVDRRLVASGSANLALGLDQLRLDGKFVVDEGVFDLSARDAPSLDDDVAVRRGVPAAPAEQSPEPPRVRRTTQVALDVDLGDKLRVRGRGLDTALKGQLKVGSAASRLTVVGIVNASGGTYAAYGQKLEIQRGLIAFSGDPANPMLDVRALRPNIDVDVGVEIVGTLQVPRVRLYSNPTMSESEKLSWLVLGRAPEGLGRTDTALLQRAAVALLAGEGEAPTDAVLRRLGIDELSLSQREGDVRETVVTLGKQLSRRWYVGYERSVNATTGTWQLIYRIAQRFTLRAQSGQENSLDVLWTWRVADPPLPAERKAAAGDAARQSSGGSSP